MTSPLLPQEPQRWKILFKRPIPIACMAVILFLILMAYLGPFMTGYTYSDQSPDQFAAPSLRHWMGTDLHGRDLLTRTMYGLQISMAVGLAGTLVSLCVGVTYGMLSGYAGGRADLVMMRLVDIVQSLPRLIFVILIITLDKGIIDYFTSKGWVGLAGYTRMLLLFVGLGAMQWLTMSRIIRGQVLVLKEQQFVMAAKSLGARAGRILIRHMLPNLVGIIIVYLTLTIPEIILLESFLSFLGLGILAPQASLGTLISEGAAAINPIQIHWHLLLGPGVVMSLLLLSLNILGDHLRDILDPKSVK